MTVAAPLKFRPVGSPAGSWPHCPWWHCVFHDPYERINFWSHFIPGVAFLLLGWLSLGAWVAGGAPLGVFGCCAAVTHLFSAITHVWPDDHFLEKLDHLGIVALIVGTPITQAMAIDPQGDRTVMWACCCGLLLAAFLPPLLRTVSFVGIGALMVVVLWHIVNTSLFLQCLLYLVGAVAFIRNGGHDRLPWGLTDHHILHYQVTVACGMHVVNLMQLQAASAAAAGTMWSTSTS